MLVQQFAIRDDIMSSGKVEKFIEEKGHGALTEKIPPHKDFFQRSVVIHILKDQNVGPGLLVSIMNPTGRVKDEV